MNKRIIEVNLWIGYYKNYSRRETSETWLGITLGKQVIPRSLKETASLLTSMEAPYRLIINCLDAYNGLITLLLNNIVELKKKVFLPNINLYIVVVTIIVRTGVRVVQHAVQGSKSANCTSATTAYNLHTPHTLLLVQASFF